MRPTDDRSPVRVFVIEGEQPLKKLLVWGLQQEGFDAVEVPTPDAAPDGYGGRGANMLVINADVPVETREQWIRHVRQTTGGVPILDLRRDGDAPCSADATLSPPHRMQQLLRLLAELSRHD